MYCAAKRKQLLILIMAINTTLRNFEQPNYALFENPTKKYRIFVKLLCPEGKCVIEQRSFLRKILLKQLNFGLTNLPNLRCLRG